MSDAGVVSIRRLNYHVEIESPEEIAKYEEAFAAEMVDRFGTLPAEVENLLQVVAVQLACKTAGVEKLEAGPKGAVIAFRENRFADPARLVEFISAQSGTAKLRPDHKLVFMRNWEAGDQRLSGARTLATQLAEMAGAAATQSGKQG